MINDDQPPTGPIRLTARSTSALQPGSRSVITGGLWHERRRINRTVSVPGAWQRLVDAGNFHNLALATGTTEGEYVNDLPFLDSDLYKWLEAIGWTFGDPELEPEIAEELTRRLRDTVAKLAAAQEPDGYLDSHFQVRFPGERFVQLGWGHELYCAGHLIQAAVAAHRTTGEQELLAVAQRFADLVVDNFGLSEDQIDGVCGHPEIETALVELARETGEQRYLEGAAYFIDRRGHGTLPANRFGAQYWQDHAPIRDVASAEGHSVRQLYLLAGVADVFAETGDEALLAAAERLWSEMVATKTYLTGGIGAHHSDEAFGDPYELPNERSYCETCAAIASIMFSWRMLMITGQAKYADLLERTLYNGFLAGISLDGSSYIYANPLQVRDDHLAHGNDADYQRATWFRCACCPPNVMRLLASLEHYVTLGGEGQLVLHQYLPGQFTADIGAGAATVEVRTDYPWQGRIGVTITAGPATPWELVLRIPHWAETFTVSINGEQQDVAASEGWLRLQRAWQPGDAVELIVPLAPRVTTADPRVDAVRGSVALERGPLVYCLEGVDHPGLRLDDVVVDVEQPIVAVPADDRLGTEVVALTVSGLVRDRAVRDRAVRDRAGEPHWWPYGAAVESAGHATQLTAVPYYTWGNRGSGAMRIWVPTI